MQMSLHLFSWAAESKILNIYSIIMTKKYNYQNLTVSLVTLKVLIKVCPLPFIKEQDNNIYPKRIIHDFCNTYTSLT